MNFQEAINVVRKTMKEDDKLWHGYQANIAMRIYDETAMQVIDHNHIADELMVLLFEAPRTDAHAKAYSNDPSEQE